MKKAGIITIYGNYNYGNRLQNFAVQEVLKKMGIDAETIIYVESDGKNIVPVEGYKEDKIEAFDYFNKNIKFYKDMLYADKFPEPQFGNDIDYYVIGSDQIWNYNFRVVFSPRVFADFANENQKRIGFSTSIGVSDAPEKGSNNYKIFEENLNKMDSITVREDAGKRIIKEISGRDDVEVVLDPTMLLEREDWEKVMRKPKNLKTDKFVIKSVLANFSKDKEEAIQKYAKENDCEILDISSEDSPYFNIGPAEFLYLEKNAKMVFTDSFHSCVFGIIFGTPFVVFERDDVVASMHSRIETLLGTFDLNYRLFDKEITEEMKKADYSKAYKILADKKKRSLECLNEKFN